MTSADRTGVVLAGGHSTRFGDRDKALADVGGRPMLTRVVEGLAPAVGRVVLNCRADQRDAFARAVAAVDVPVRFAVDATPGEGPLAGVRRALAGVESEYAAVVACDVPGLDPALVDLLFERAAGHDGAVPEGRDGTLQPTQAVYRVAAMAAAADEELAAGRRSLRGALDGLDHVVVPAETVRERADPRALRDVNTPEALADFESDRPRRP